MCVCIHVCSRTDLGTGLLVTMVPHVYACTSALYSLCVYECVIHTQHCMCVVQCHVVLAVIIIVHLHCTVVNVNCPKSFLDAAQREKMREREAREQDSCSAGTD